MANHLPAPSGGKMHKCSECQKSFGQAGHLKIHMLTHSTERTYACVQCQRYWGGTWSPPTVGRKYTTVKNAESPLAELVLWKGTCSFTMGRSHTNAHNAIMRLHAQTISKQIPTKAKAVQMVRLLHNPIIKPYKTYPHPQWSKATSL